MSQVSHAVSNDCQLDCFFNSLLRLTRNESTVSQDLSEGKPKVTSVDTPHKRPVVRKAMGSSRRIQYKCQTIFSEDVDFVSMTL